MLAGFESRKIGRLHPRPQGELPNAPPARLALLTDAGPDPLGVSGLRVWPSGPRPNGFSVLHLREIHDVVQGSSGDQDPLRGGMQERMRQFHTVKLIQEEEQEQRQGRRVLGGAVFCCPYRWWFHSQVEVNKVVGTIALALAADGLGLVASCARWNRASQWHSGERSTEGTPEPGALGSTPSRVTISFR